ncbi:hypothetical protein FRC16_006789, partial [Serendipita sp. 398]
MSRFITLNDSARAYVSGAERASNKEALIRHLGHVLLPHQNVASTLSAQGQMKVQLDSSGNNNGPISIKIAIPAMGKSNKVESRAFYVIRNKHQEKTEGRKKSHARLIAIGLAEKLMCQVECCQWVLRKPVELSGPITRYTFDCALRDINNRSKVESGHLFMPDMSDPYTSWTISPSLRTDIRKTIAERTSSCGGALTVDVIRTLTFGGDQILIVLADLRHKQAHQPIDYKVLPTRFLSSTPSSYIHVAEIQSSVTRPATGSHTTEGPSASSNVAISTNSSSGPKPGPSLPTESKSKSKAAILEKRAYIEDTKSKLLIAKDILRALGKRPRTPEPCSPIKKQKTNAMKAILSPIKATGTTNNS